MTCLLSPSKVLWSVTFCKVLREKIKSNWDRVLQGLVIYRTEFSVLLSLGSDQLNQAWWTVWNECQDMKQARNKSQLHFIDLKDYHSFFPVLALIEVWVSNNFLCTITPASTQILALIAERIKNTTVFIHRIFLVTQMTSVWWWKIWNYKWNVIKP